MRYHKVKHNSGKHIVLWGADARDLPPGTTMAEIQRITKTDWIYVLSAGSWYRSGHCIRLSDAKERLTKCVSAMPASRQPSNPLKPS